MMTKLAPITTQYRTFVDNQVLTDDQLNEFLAYFEDQDHLTRIGLSGVGLVCGFNLSLHTASSAITVTPGVGVTTDGDMLVLKKPSEGINEVEKEIAYSDKVYTHYKLFQDIKAQYPFFQGLTLMELYTDDEVDAANPDFVSLAEVTDLRTKVVLLYLENYAKSGDLCDVLGCDNQGVEQVARLKVLLIDPTDAETITNPATDPLTGEILFNDDIFGRHNFWGAYDSLKKVAVPRVVLNASNATDLSVIQDLYKDAINSTVPNLEVGLLEATRILKLESSYSWNLSSFPFDTSANPHDFQYGYDALKDLVDTYNEIRTLLLHLNVECLPNINAFPKHLLLGTLNTDETVNTYRHRFYKSPIFDEANHNLKRVRSLLERAWQIRQRYVGASHEPLEITPSSSHTLLTNKAVPYYYDIDDDFLENWNFDFSYNRISKFNLSYHRAKLEPINYIEYPLHFNKDPYNFYRIEGFLGADYEDVADGIRQKIKEHGLDFDVKSLSLKPYTGTVNYQDYPCEFNDLYSMFWLCIWDILCLIIKVYLPLFQEIFKNRSDVSNLAYKSPMPDDGTLNFKEGQAPEFLLRSPKENLLAYLPKQPGGLGYHIREAFEGEENPCGGDIYKRAMNSIRKDRAKNPPKKGSQESIGDLSDYLEIVTIAYELDQLTPRKMSDLNEENLAAFRRKAEDLDKKTKEYEGRQQIQTKSMNLFKDWNSTSLLNLFCLLMKLYMILAEYNRRINGIKRSLEFRYFVNKHPGLEHLAGVQQGGTFILLYDEQKKVVADFAIPYRCCSDCKSETRIIK